MSKILITGATGNTGSELVRQLSQKGIHFKAMIRDKGEAKPTAGVDWVEGSFGDAKSLVSAFDGVEQIYVSMPAHPENETWIRNIISAAKEAGVKHIVKLSGMGASLDAGSEIIRTHAKTDNLIINSGLTFTLLQPNSFYQNTFNSISTIKSQNAIYTSLADSKQSFIDIRDIAAVAVKALAESGHENKIYKLSGPEALSFFEVAYKIGTALGKEVTYYPISDEQMKLGMLGAGLPEWGADKISEIFGWFAKGGYESVTSDVESVLGRLPYSFDDFINEYKAEFQ